MKRFEPGQIVKYREPLTDAERTAKYEVVEDRERYYLARVVCDLPIAPVVELKHEDIELVRR
jgi:hypothetical protein